MVYRGTHLGIEDQAPAPDKYVIPKRSLEDEWNEMLICTASEEDSKSSQKQSSCATHPAPLAPPSRKEREQSLVEPFESRPGRDDRTGRSRTRSISRGRSTSRRRGPSIQRSENLSKSTKQEKSSRPSGVNAYRPHSRETRTPSKEERYTSDPEFREPHHQVLTTTRNGAGSEDVFRQNSSEMGFGFEEQDKPKKDKLGATSRMNHIQCFGHGMTWTLLAMTVSSSGLAFAVLGRQSMHFVELREPWRIAPIYNEVSSLGMINVQLCYNETATIQTDSTRVGCFTVPLATNKNIDDTVLKVSAILTSLAALLGAGLTLCLSTSIIWRTINLRVLGAGYLLVYCFQSLAFLFFNTNICHDHDCKVGIGCTYCIFASILWIASCLTCAKMEFNRARAELAAERKQRKDDASKKATASSVLNQSTGTVTTERTASTYSDELTTDIDEEIALPLNDQGYSTHQFDMCSIGMSLGLPMTCADKTQCRSSHASKPMKRHSTGVLYPQHDLNQFVKTPSNRRNEEFFYDPQDSGESRRQDRSTSKTRSRSECRHREPSEHQSVKSTRTKSSSIRRQRSVSRETRSRSYSKTRMPEADEEQYQISQEFRSRSVSRPRIPQDKRARSESAGTGWSTTWEREPTFQGRTSRELSRGSGDEVRCSSVRGRRPHSRSRSTSANEMCSVNSSSEDAIMAYWNKVQQKTIAKSRPAHDRYETVQLSSPGLTSPSSTMTMPPSSQNKLGFVTSYFDI